MKPILFSFKLPLLGDVVFPAYFTLLTLGFACAILLTWRDARRLRIDPDKIIDINLWMIIFGVLGARVLHVLADGHFMEYVNICIKPEVVQAVGDVPAHCTADAQCAPYFLCNTAAGWCHPPRDCLLALKVWRGGLTYYGGFIAAVAFGLYYLHKHKLPIWRVTDLSAYGIPLGLFWGRMGCFLNGCCFGKVTHSHLGLVFPRGGAAWRHQLDAHLIAESAAALPVYPTQLYQALLNLGIFFVCYFWIRPRKRFDGQVFWMFVLLKTITRSALEVLRDDDRGVLFGFLSTSQLISIPFFVLALYMMRRLGRRAAAAPAPAA
jgi:phosphatidylglycerol---prolipoprotein diacylglyceryl transferase